MNTPLYLARSGFIAGDSIDHIDSGYYWSNTVGGPEIARYLYFASSTIGLEGNYIRYRGFSLRCVLREFLIVSLKAQPTADQASV